MVLQEKIKNEIKNICLGMVIDIAREANESKRQSLEQSRNTTMTMDQGEGQSPSKPMTANASVRVDSSKHRGVPESV